ncbi:MAG: LysM peptidoglycan-binding domain-containing protein, partial [Anaerolineae bacterium]|nr:LysM peptidoglycan-binding domain-containing protein [Anaerolineae bacterium]
MVRFFIMCCFAGMLLGLPAFAVGQQSADVTVHVVQRGESLYRIALQYGLTVDDLAQFNAIPDPTNIQVGQRLLIPLPGGQTASAVPETHVVQAGETLKGIADLYGLAVEVLAAANNITNIDAIFVGQVLTISSAPVASAAPTSVPPPPVEAVPLSGVNLVYTVQPGETLFRIATRYGLTVNDVARANNISDPTLIFSGQQIIIPGIEPPQLTAELPPNVTGIDLSPLILVEGQTGRLRLTTAVPLALSGTFLGRSLVSFTDTGVVHTIFIGIPVFTEPGVYPLDLSLTDAAGTVSTMQVNVQVLSGSYGSETITILADRTDLLDTNVEAAEQSLIEGVMNQLSPTRFFEGPMGLPAAASISSPFGRNRSYNGGPITRFHSGTDFAGAPGSPVLAAAPGVIVLADTLNVRGRATVIDHGWGIFTGYWHQTDQYVQVGDVVSVGQVIGTIGSSGRVTGPHLH